MRPRFSKSADPKGSLRMNPSRNSFALAASLAGALAASSAPSADAPASAEAPRGGFRAPQGWSVETVADESLVLYPQFACLDDRGRLYVAEGTGKNLPGPEIEPLKLAKISLLEDTDGDGRFDTRKVFADGLVFGSGVLWHDGSVYAASHPAIWKLTDTDGDGVADRREELVGKFGFTGNGCDIHGPFFGPDGWLYWTQGRHGYRIATREGRHLEGLAARVWRCRLDGTGIERVAGGGFDNTVELVFTETGDLCGTMDQYPGDMLLQFVDGGVYPRPDEPTIAEFPRTGPLLTPIAGFSAAYPAALCGLERLRSDHFGPGHRGTLLTTQFNVRRLQRHTLQHDGARLTSENSDFLVSTDWDFHPTDALEDADGSLLVIDMGSWFNYDCPTQKIAKEQVTGVIYRVRRLDAPKPEDPWGKKIAWSSQPVEKLVSWLGDARHQVAARAVEELVKRGAASVSALADLAKGAAPEASSARREAVYALSRINTTEARAAVRGALDHADAGVREVAAHCASVERDAAALPALARLVVEDSAPIRRKAAEALGRIGEPEAVPPLLASLRKGAEDSFLQHSLIYALIRIGAFEETLPALSDASVSVRRAALIALDQMNGGEERTEQPAARGHALPNPHRGGTFRHLPNAKLAREHIAPLLDADDAALQLAVLEAISRRPAWTQELVTVAARWVRRDPLEAAQREALVTALLGASAETPVQQFIAATLLDAGIPAETRKDLFGVIARSRVQPQPPLWLDTLEKILRGGDAAAQREALNVVRIRNLTQFDKLLAELGNSGAAAPDVRLAATAVLAPRTTLDAAVFDRLTAQLAATGDPLLPVAAATALGTSRLTTAQRQALIGKIAEAGPLTLPLLVKAFYRTPDKPTAIALAKALVASPGSRSLPADELEQIYSARLLRDPEIDAAAKPLIEQHRQTHAQQAQYLAELGEKMSAGAADIRRGEEVFFSQKAMCAVCHHVNGRGGHLGPDLSRIGSIRITRALLEAIVFPSSTIVPDFRAYNLKLKSGGSAYGAIARETPDAVFLRTTTLEETRIPRAGIAGIEPSDLSFMPQGMEKVMTPQELNDLLEYLYSLK